MNTVVQILDTIAEEAARADRTDGQLLDLFVRLRDAEAFAAVVRRHGPMVLGVCRRILRNSADADDAFQAAFLVLARKAASISTRHLLGQWLYGVAYNTARKLRQSNARRAIREQPLADAAEPQANGPNPRDELLAILDEELARLPDRYRAVIVLCDLQGLTRREAAQALACPEGTVAGRLARARDLLAARLTARGVVSAAALLVAVLTQSVAHAVPSTVAAAVVRAVGVDNLAGAATQGLISPRVADTTEGVLKAMFATKLRTGALALCCGLTLVLVAGAIHFANAQPAPEPRGLFIEDGGAPPAKPEPERKVSSEKPVAITSVEPLAKVLTVFPLKKLDPEATAKVISDAFKGKGVTVTALAKDKALLIYADEIMTPDVVEMLKKLGEAPPKQAVALTLKRGQKATEVAELLRTLLARRDQDAPVLVPVPDDNVVLLFGDEVQIQLARKIVDLNVAVPPKTPKDFEKPGATPKPGPKKYLFRFKNAKWDDVLEWYAKETGLTMITTVKPTGTVTFEPAPGTEYTLDEITDLINETMAQQKFILIRRHMTFFIHPADEKIDPAGVLPRVEICDLSELAKRGKTEIVQVILPLGNLKVADVQDEVKKLLTPFGSMVSLEKANSLLIQDTVGNINRIRETLNAIEKQVPKLGDPIVPRDLPVRQKTYLARFQQTPWQDMIKWYATESGLMRVGDTLPKGTFTLGLPQDPKALEILSPSLTLDEIADYMNEALLKQNWLLVRDENSLTIVPADEKVDSRWVSQIARGDLHKHRRYTLVEMTIEFGKTDATELVSALRKKLTPFGSVSALPKSNGIVIRDIAGNLRDIAKAHPELLTDTSKAPSVRQP